MQANNTPRNREVLLLVAMNSKPIQMGSQLIRVSGNFISGDAVYETDERGNLVYERTILSRTCEGFQILDIWEQTSEENFPTIQLFKTVFKKLLKEGLIHQELMGNYVLDEPKNVFFITSLGRSILRFWLGEIENPKRTKVLRGVSDCMNPSCWSANGNVCSCKCRGTNHAKVAA